MDYARTCRFCHKSNIWDTDEAVKYGARSYAHFECYLDAGKDLFRLSRWQVGKFPYRLLKKRGLVDEIERMKRVGDLIGNW